MLTSADRRVETFEREHRPARITLLREIKGSSPVHRMWAGTKLLAVAVISVTLSYFPSWGALGVVLALLAATALVARIPRGAWPRPPAWFWVVFLFSAVVTAGSGGSPHLLVAGTELGLGGIDAFLRFVGVGVLLLLAAALVGWTTALGDVAPAIASILRPLRWLRVPVEEWSVAIALCVRSLPLLVVELRTLVAARRLRPAPARPTRTTWRSALDEPIDLLVAAMSVSMRRAGELAEAISARGGTGLVATKRAGPRWADLLALVLVAAVCTGAALLPGS